MHPHIPDPPVAKKEASAAPPFGGSPEALPVIVALRRERRRVAQRLHDTACQSLSGIQMLAKVLARRLLADAPRLRESAEDLVRMVQEAGTELHILARSLQEPCLQGETLLTALTRLAEASEADAIPCQVQPCAHEGFSWPKGLPAAELYYVAQEAVENARQHSCASRIRIVLQASPTGAICLTVEDDGCGFDVSAALAAGAPGLVLQQAHAHALRATLHFESLVGSGTSVVCQVPPARPCPPQP